MSVSKRKQLSKLHVYLQPSWCGTKQARSEILQRGLQGMDIITRDVGFCFSCIQSLRCKWHLEPSVVDEPGCSDCGKSERQAESPEGRCLRIWWLSFVTTSDHKNDDENGLVNELTPSDRSYVSLWNLMVSSCSQHSPLHQESHGDFATTM